MSTAVEQDFDVEDDFEDFEEDEDVLVTMQRKLDVLEERLWDVALDAARAEDEKRDREFEQMLLDRRLKEIEARLAKLEALQS